MSAISASFGSAMSSHEGVPRSSDEVAGRPLAHAVALLDEEPRGHPRTVQNVSHGGTIALK